MCSVFTMCLIWHMPSTRIDVALVLLALQRSVSLRKATVALPASPRRCSLQRGLWTEQALVNTAVFVVSTLQHRPSVRREKGHWCFCCLDLGGCGSSAAWGLPQPPQILAQDSDVRGNDATRKSSCSLWAERCLTGMGWNFSRGVFALWEMLFCRWLM